MNVKEMRIALKHAWSGDRWAKRVSTMSDAQVIAIYLRFSREGKV